MKAKRALLLCLMLSMLCTVTAFADAGAYESFTKANVRVNGAELTGDGVQPFVINGETVVPLRQTAEALHAMVKWEESSHSAYLYLPNVNMLFGEDIQTSGGGLFKKPEHTDLVSTFSRVPNGKSLNFYIMVQVDNLRTSVSGYRISIAAPDGSEVYNAEESKDISEESFWLQFQQKIKFTQKGNYNVRFAFFLNGQYYVVAEKQILSE